MMNRVLLVGRLTKDPVLRYTPNGVAVATLTLAVNRTFSNQEGERETDFINCIVWRKQAENAANFLKKGNLTGIDGRLQTRNFENSEGKRVFVTEVVAESVQFLESRGNSQQREANQNNHNQSNRGSNNQHQGNNYGQNQGYNEDPFENGSQPYDDGLPF